MVNGLHLHSTFLPYRTKAHYNFASRSPIHTHTHSHTAAIQGPGLPIGSNLGFSVLLKDTLMCTGRAGNRTANLGINGQPTLPPEPQILVLFFFRIFPPYTFQYGLIICKHAYVNVSFNTEEDSI